MVVSHIGCDIGTVNHGSRHSQTDFQWVNKRARCTFFSAWCMEASVLVVSCTSVNIDSTTTMSRRMRLDHRPNETQSTTPKRQNTTATTTGQTGHLAARKTQTSSSTLANNMDSPDTNSPKSSAGEDVQPALDQPKRSNAPSRLNKTTKMTVR